MLRVPKSKTYQYTHLALMYIGGSIYPILNSIILNKPWKWTNNLEMKFMQPWFLNIFIFLGMFLLIIPYFVISKTRPFNKYSDQPSGWSLFRIVSIPSLSFIISSVLQTYALLYMPTTIWQLFIGFQVLFTTLFAVTVRHQKLFLVDWLGLFITVMGICMAGISAMLRGITDQDTSITQIFFSFVLVILSHGIRSFQTIREEQLAQDCGAEPIEIAALEGVWSLFLSVFVAVPLANVAPQDLGAILHESTSDAFKMLSYNPQLCFLLLGVLLSATAYTYAGVCVTAFSDAIHRSLYEMVRPFIVWVASTALFYAGGGPYAGGKVDGFSALEIGGFVVTVVGTFVYNRAIRLPCFVYNDGRMADLASLSGNVESALIA